MTQSSAAITARGIRKSFGEHTVLADVDLEVDQGKIFGRCRRDFWFSRSRRRSGR